MPVFRECEGVRSRRRACAPRGDLGVQEETEALMRRQALLDEMGWVIVFGPANGSPLLTSLCWAGPQKQTGDLTGLSGVQRYAKTPSPFRIQKGLVPDGDGPALSTFPQASARPQSST